MSRSMITVLDGRSGFAGTTCDAKSKVAAILRGTFLIQRGRRTLCQLRRGRVRFCRAPFPAKRLYTLPEVSGAALQRADTRSQISRPGHLTSARFDGRRGVSFLRGRETDSACGRFIAASGARLSSTWAAGNRTLWGEAQRIKLATELQRVQRGKTLHVLDEPTTGLHPADVSMLMSQLRGLVDAGNTVIVVEHDMQIAASSDWIIDIGPGAGNEGGEIVAQGPTALVAKSKTSRTAPFLRKHLKSAKRH